MARDEFELYSTRLFDDWEAYVSNVLKLSDYSLALEVEEGSIKAVGRIAATLGVLYIAIGQYGSFISGVQTIQSQIRTVDDYLGDRAAEPFGVSPQISKRGESLSRIQTLFVKVQRRQLTVEEAMLETEAIFGSELETAPEFVSMLRDSLEKAPLYPEQAELELVNIDGVPLTLSAEKKKRTRLRTPTPPMPDPDQYRVEIWRENKRSKRNIRVVKLD